MTEASTTIRVTRQTHQQLTELARQSGKSLQVVAAEAVERHRRAVFLDGLSADFAALRADPAAWADYQEELAAWDVTLGDGLPAWDESAVGTTRAATNRDAS